MPRHSGSPTLLVLAALGLAGAGTTRAAEIAPPAPATAIDFNRDVRPILSNNCFKCHGFDEKARKGDRRLDTREGALAENEGFRAIVPGNLAESDLHVRIRSTDRDEQMPPPKGGKKLTPAQMATLDAWIQQGAPYAGHWAFQKPVQPPVPTLASPKGRVENPIDAFVLARLEKENLAPSPEADKDTLIRRLSLDLTGLPPTPEEADAFAQDVSPEAYEKLVDRLIASPRYGERWARRWLDLARYADTNGYEKDRERSIWPYRDWVIRALNAGMPFDQFTIEQIAGDLLPDATLDQRIATGFHRNAMLNDEGGIDPLEYRYLAMVDRVATTGTTWLGLTTGCAQCHAHKYDPIPQREYFQFMACLDNADEPELEVPAPDAAAQEKARAEKLAKRLAELPGQFPVETDWEPLRPVQIETASGQQPTILDDGSALFAAKGTRKDTYTFTVETAATSVSQLRLEALGDPSLPAGGPGQATQGNFVLSEITVIAAPKDAPAQTVPVKIARAEADVEQANYPIAHAIDGDTATGWAVLVPDTKWNVTHRATFTLAEPITFPAGTRLTVKLDQQYGGQHTLGRVRLSVPVLTPDPRPVEVRRQEVVAARFAEWLKRERSRAVAWTPLRPVEAKANSPWLTVQEDASIFARGDFTKSDTYELKFANVPRGIAAVRLEVLPDDRLPGKGPGTAYYEGPKGDFFLSEFQLSADGQPVKFVRTSQTFAANALGPNNPVSVSAALTTDGDPQTGWSAHGHQGQADEAVFVLATPLTEAGTLTLKMLCGRHYVSSLGRFRISVTTEPRTAEARQMPDDIAQLLLVADEQLTELQRARLREQFLLSAPEFTATRQEIDALRKASKNPTTLVLRERPSENSRTTYFHARGEWLQPKERVEPGVLSAVGPWPADAPHNRLGLACWLVSPENPLTARVVMNREWAAFFGRGLVRTIGDFGLQGDSPTHPELLDWLAVEFMQRGWSLKQMHKLMVMSATYRQSSKAEPEGLAVDPDNHLLARGPRFRLEAEMVRDSALLASGLLVEKIGGPSVRPPQPDGVTEVAFSSPKWNASTGPDRYRRSLYTFAKRTAPFALYSTFDAPTGEACIARREVSNTPLQALALLNDIVFLEAAQALGKSLAAQPGTIEERIRTAFRRVLTRPPTERETTMLAHFVTAQRARFATAESDAKKLAPDGPGEAAERAAWTAVARVLFNLDETISRN